MRYAERKLKEAQQRMARTEHSIPIGPAFSPISSTNELEQFSLRSGRKKRPIPLTDASEKLLHQVLHFVSIASNRQNHFEIEAIILVLIVLVIDFTAFLCRRERRTLALVPANGSRPFACC
jgi:hypothetical protein